MLIDRLYNDIDITRALVISFVCAISLVMAKLVGCILPLLAKNDFEEGTGHNSIIKENGEYYIVYHGRDYLDLKEEYERRTARICKMKVDGNKLTAIRYKDKL